MVNAETGFAQYSKAFCFAMSFIGLLLAILSFTSDASNGTTIGFLWLVVATALAVSSIFLKRNVETDAG